MLFHISPKRNHNSIERSGIEPMYSKGARKEVWLVTQDRILWALAHCSARHKVDVGALEVWSIPQAKRVKNTRLPGVFTSPCRQNPGKGVNGTYYVTD